jgi:hypothetical protein
MNKHTLDQVGRAGRTHARVLGVTAAVVVAVMMGVAAGTNASAASGRTTAVTKFVSGPPGPEAVPLQKGTVLAPASTAATGRTVDGIQCNATEQVAFHVHAHLAVYVNGQLRPIPAGIGIVAPAAQSTPEGPFYAATRCYYWLHVHAQDGVIHIESPTKSTYTLGQFFAIWGQPLTRTSVGTATGNLTVYVNGKRYTGDPTGIPLGSREDIQISVGTPVAPQPVDWSKSQL